MYTSNERLFIINKYQKTHLFIILHIHKFIYIIITIIIFIRRILVCFSLVLEFIFFLFNSNMIFPPKVLQNNISYFLLYIYICIFK